MLHEGKESHLSAHRLSSRGHLRVRAGSHSRSPASRLQ